MSTLRRIVRGVAARERYLRARSRFQKRRTSARKAM
jgi:hypothetical protein